MLDNDASAAVASANSNDDESGSSVHPSFHHSHDAGVEGTAWTGTPLPFPLLRVSLRER
jgi:hypothetical protein